MRINTWLSRSREQRAGRATADRTVVLLQELALAMQDDVEGRKTQVSKRWGAEKIAAELGGGQITKDTAAAAERFLDDEEVDSGIHPGQVARMEAIMPETHRPHRIGSRAAGRRSRLRSRSFGSTAAKARTAELLLSEFLYLLRLVVDRGKPVVDT